MGQALIKLASWAIGFSLGAAVAAVIVALFAPISADEVRARLRAGYQETLAEARKAALAERERLEKQLADMQSKRALPEGETDE